MAKKKDTKDNLLDGALKKAIKGANAQEWYKRWLIKLLIRLASYIS